MPEWAPRLEANVLLDFEGDLRDLAAYEQHGGYRQLRRAVDSLTTDDIIGAVSTSGFGTSRASAKRECARSRRALRRGRKF